MFTTSRVPVWPVGLGFPFCSEKVLSIDAAAAAIASRNALLISSQSWEVVAVCEPVRFIVICLRDSLLILSATSASDFFTDTAHPVKPSVAPSSNHAHSLDRIFPARIHDEE